MFIKSNNYASNRINGEWLENFNKKWSKEFDGFEDWSDSPKFKEYEKAYVNNLVKLSNKYLKTTTKSEFTTKLGQTYTAGFLEEHGQQIIWATPRNGLNIRLKNNTHASFTSSIMETIFLKGEKKNDREKNLENLQAT